MQGDVEITTSSTGVRCGCRAAWIDACEYPNPLPGAFNDQENDVTAVHAHRALCVCRDICVRCERGV